MSIEEQKSAQAVDVLAVMDCLVDLARHRLTMKRRDIDRKVVVGKKPHFDIQIKADRAEYIFQQGREARAIVAKLIERDRTAGYTHEGVMRLVEAAGRYFNGYCQDEAEETEFDAKDYGKWTGCSREQADDARRLEAALATFTHQAKDGSR